MKKIVGILVLSCFLNSMIAQKTDHFQVKPLKRIKKKIRQDLNGSGVQIKNVRYKGKRRAIGEFWNGTSIIQLSHGIVLSTGIAQTAQGENNNRGKTGVNQRKGHRLFKTLSDQKLYDAAVLQFDFYPNSDYISFNFVFASEDYPEFSTSNYNDILAFILTLPDGKIINLATLPNSKELVSVSSVNPTIHPQYYINNSQQEVPEIKNELDTFWEYTSSHKMLLTRSWNIQKAMTSESNYPIQFDGFTKVIKAQYPVLPNQKYRLQIAIADNGNSIFDSAVFIEMKSLYSHPMPNFQAGILKEDPNYYKQIDTISVVRMEEKTKSVLCLTETKDLLFYYDSPKLSQRNQALLNNLGMQLKKCPNLRLRIVGYAAAKDDKEYNRKLSRERAEGVQAYLMNLGIEGTRIEVNWQGDETKVTKSALTQNRRVKLEIFTK